MTFKNMKFKVDSTDQQEALYTLLVKQEYNPEAYDFAKGDPTYYVFASWDGTIYYDGAESIITNCSGTPYEEMSTAAFLAAHEPAPAPTIVTHPDGFWFDNTGTMPDLPAGTLVDLEYKYGGVVEKICPSTNDWDLYGGNYQIVKWRYHRSSDPAGHYVQPKTEPKGIVLPAGQHPSDFTIKSVVPSYEDTQGCVDLTYGETTKPAIDSHYNFSYTLTEADKLAGTIKIDPYFVSQQWQLGSKDSTGVVFHLLKTLARFGDKNSKEREINALHKSIVRLAQLEGVTLK